LRGLLKANDQMQTAKGQDRAAQLVHQNEMPNIPESVLLDMIKTRTFTMTVDPPLLEDLQRMTDFLLKAGRIDQPVEAESGCDPRCCAKSVPTWGSQSLELISLPRRSLLPGYDASPGRKSPS
jgi:hypothetical protein